MTSEQIAKRKAKSLGYDTVEYAGDWNGMQVFDYYNSGDPEGSAVGLPSFIVANQAQARVVNGRDALKLIEIIDPEQSKR